MAEIQSSPEQEHDPPIDRQLVVGRLQEYGVPIELDDFEDEDDNDVLGIIAGYAIEYDLDVDEILREVTPIEKRRKEELGE